MAPAGTPSYPKTAFILSLVGGLLILLVGIYYAAVYAVVGSIALSILPGLGALFIALAVVAVIFGLLIIFGAVQLKSKPQSAHTWGIVIILLSILSWVGGGGFGLGFILALVGGIFALTWKPPQTAQPAWGQAPMAPPTPPPTSPPPS